MESASRILRCLLATLIVVSACQVASAQTVLPSDAENRCPIEGAALRSWFASASVAKDGIVKAPNNLTLPTNQNVCGFFERSAQMFLWLTSPPPPAYGGGSRVFKSPLFYEVLRDQDPKFRVFRPMSSEALRSLDLNLPQLGPGNIPFFFFFDKGELLTIVRPESGPNSKPAIQNKSGDAIEIEHAQIQKDGRLIFLDKDGKPIFLDKVGKPIFLDKDGKPNFLDKGGKPIETEVGQLNQAVLMARDDRLVYYMVQVNDVFAYFLTGTANGGITPTPTRFPASESELGSIQRFAEAHAKRFLEPNVLTVTLKSAWVETAGFSPDERRKYLTMTATIPEYKKDGDKKLVLNGTKSAELALVGMHVVFGLLGHPEKIWATFEHVDNTPHDTYFYLDREKDQNRIMVPRPTGGTWLFSTDSTAPDVNRPRMVLRGDGSIEVEDPSQAIGPSNLLRINPWGVPGGKNAARENTDVISFNRNLIEQLHPDDVRRNYLLIGATWTVAGGVPPQHQEGTSIAANTTMESFHQHVRHGCFGCHKGDQTMLGLPEGKGGLSRIWGRLKPLFSAK